MYLMRQIGFAAECITIDFARFLVFLNWHELCHGSWYS